MTEPALQAVLRPNSRAIAAMRRAFQEQRFGLVLGAGVSRAFNFDVPDWKELLNHLASHPKVDGTRVDAPSAALASRADLLFRRFSAKVHKDLDAHGRDDYVVDQIARGEWRALIRDILYEGAPANEDLAQLHPYLGEYLDLVTKSPLTITYNFDSYLEMMLAARSMAMDERGRPYEVVFDGSKPFRSTTGVIYHPNGYLPKNVLERASDDVVFSEEQFGDQLIASMAGQYSSLVHHLSKTTCLFVGLSLSDETLRHLLRRNSINNPGHFHYLVEWVDSASPLTPERADALYRYRFSAYNLVTLFLDDEGIRALARLIKMPFDDYRRVAEEAGVPVKYVYYLTGVPGIGKTTLLRHLASLSIYDEWPADPLPLLARPHNSLSEDEKRLLDDWVAKQMRDKNESLIREREGLFVVERGPLDPISFEEGPKLLEKARWYSARVVPTAFDSLCPGQVVLLWGDAQRVSVRLANRQSIQQPPEYLDELQDRLRNSVYTGTGVRQLKSTEWTINQLVREVVELIHLDDFESADLQSRLKELASSSSSK